MNFAILSAAALAGGVAGQPADATVQAVEQRDERVVVLPGEPPIARGPAATEAALDTPTAGEGTAELGPDGRPVIVVSGEAGPPPGDPIVAFNVQAFEAAQAVDRAIVEPIANAYRDDLPEPLRDGLGNFIRNLREPIVFLSYILQLKPGKAMETLGRFAINSTIGIGGLIDVAKEESFNLPYHKNGLANTLGYYGVGPGPFLYLPLLGATTVRDLLGGLVDQSILPSVVGKPLNKPYYSVPAFVVGALDERIAFDSTIEDIHQAEDPYTAVRETYLERRRQEIEALHGRYPPAETEQAAPDASATEDEPPASPVTIVAEPVELGSSTSAPPEPAVALPVGVAPAPLQPAF